MHFIIGWEALEKRFITLFKLDINEALECTLNDKNFTNLPHETDAPDYYLKSLRSTQITPLQGLILEATNQWSPISILNLIKNLITYDKKLISECDSHGQNIYHYLARLKKVSHMNDEAKAIIAHISVLVETEHRKQFQCSQKHIFFKKNEFHPLLPVAEDMLREKDNNKGQCSLD